MDMIICRICGMEYNRHAMTECPFREDRHRSRRFVNRETGVSGMNIFAVSVDGDEELRERRSLLDDHVLVQWFDRGREIHEHRETFPEI